MPATTATNVTSGNSGASVTSVTTASISTTPYDLILLSAYNRVSSGTPNVPTASGAGLTWTQVGTNTLGTQRLTVFRALSSASGSGTVTIDYAGQTNERHVWIIDSFHNVDPTGVNGANAIVQALSTNKTGTNTSITVTLAAFGGVNNSTYGTMVDDSNLVITVGSGFTQLANASGSSRGVSEWRVDNDTTVDWTWGSANSTQWAFGIEIKNGVAPTGAFFVLL